MSEIWDNFMNWYNSANINTILNWLLTIAIPTIIGVLVKSSGKAKINEILAQTKNEKLQELFSGLIASLTAKIEVVENGNINADEKIDKLSALLLLVINNSNISAEDKQYALKVYNATTQNVAKEIVKVKDVVEEVVAKVEESVNKGLEEEKAIGTALDQTLEMLKKDVKDNGNTKA
jgi:uncharacterized UPF0160 family protein